MVSRYSPFYITVVGSDCAEKAAFLNAFKEALPSSNHLDGIKWFPQNELDVSLDVRSECLRTAEIYSNGAITAGFLKTLEHTDCLLVFIEHGDSSAPEVQFCRDLIDKIPNTVGGNKPPLTFFIKKSADCKVSGIAGYAEKVYCANYGRTIDGNRAVFSKDDAAAIVRRIGELGILRANWGGRVLDGLRQLSDWINASETSKKVVWGVIVLLLLGLSLAVALRTGCSPPSPPPPPEQCSCLKNGCQCVLEKCVCEKCGCPPECKCKSAPPEGGISDPPPPELENLKQDKIAYDSVREKKDEQSCGDYIGKFPKGRMTGQVKAYQAYLIKRQEVIEKNKSGICPPLPDGATRWLGVVNGSLYEEGAMYLVGDTPIPIKAVRVRTWTEYGWLRSSESSKEVIVLRAEITPRKLPLPQEPPLPEWNNTKK